MFPLVKIAKVLTGWMAPKNEGPSLSRDDFLALAKVGRKEGVVGADEARAIGALLTFRGLSAKDIITPRTVMATLPAIQKVGEVLATDPSFKFSRIPIYQDHDDDIVGFVRKDDIYKEIAEGRLDTSLASIKRDLLTVLDVKALPDVMQIMANMRISMCLVVNEYGDPLGIATMEDLLETMLGIEIVDESDIHVDMQERARELWRLRASTARSAGDIEK
jgi:CBS domain containing-hemolysin-like protein